MEWQPIETAPDGVWVLIARCAPNTQWCGRIEVAAKRADGFGSFNRWFPPTHWMPLPEPPMTTETELMAKAREITHQSALNVLTILAASNITESVRQAAVDLGDAVQSALRSAQPPADIVQTAHWLVQLGREATAQDIHTVTQWVLDTAAIEGEVK